MANVTINNTYIFENNAYINLSSVYLYNIGASRKHAIEVIRDLRYGNSFIHNKQAYYEGDKIALTDEELKKLFVSMGYMNRIIKQIVNFCPRLSSLEGKTRNIKKLNRLKKSLKINDWDLLQGEIIDGLEEGGDVFLEVYFVKEDEIPRLRILDSSKMSNIIADNYGNTKAFIYKDTVVDESYDDYGNVDRSSSREVTWVFEKGMTTIIDPTNYAYDENGLVIKDIKGKKVIKPQVIRNKLKFANEFLILHIPSFKRQAQVFSDIPASGYVDYCIWADAIATDYRYTNRLAGFPISIVINGVVNAMSSRSPGGFIFIDPKDAQAEKNPQFQSIEIKNDLETFEREWQRVENALFETADLMKPTNQAKASGSDSSRVYAQGYIPLEMKLKRYLWNINKAMNKYFDIVQMAYDYKTIEDIWFEMPEVVLEMSPFDRQVYDAQAIKAGFKTLKQWYKSKGYSEEEINQQFEQMNKEMVEQNKDITISNEIQNRVDNANNVPDYDIDDNNLDNRLK